MRNKVITSILPALFLLPMAAWGMERIEAMSTLDYSELSLSLDGRYIVFDIDRDDASNLYAKVLLYDRVYGKYEWIDLNSAGEASNDGSFNSNINADGRYVVFESYANNLVTGDTNGARDVFIRDRINGTTERISVNSSGFQGNYSSNDPSISADGRYVVFGSGANNLVSGDTNNGAWDIFIRDRINGTTERISVSSSGFQGNNSSNDPSISADGRYVVFDSYASNLVSGDTNDAADIFIRDRINGTTERISVSSGGGQSNEDSKNPSISADGRYVVFRSNASNLVSDDTCCTWDIFIRDRDSKTTERISVSSSGAVANHWSYSPSISADGRYIVFSSGADNLVAGDTNGAGDIFIRDRVSKTTERISVNSSGTEGNNGSGAPFLSADGRYVVFYSAASNLVPGDTNHKADIFITENPFISHPRPIFQTRQQQCFDSVGTAVPCKDSGQDGDHQAGLTREIHYDFTNHTLKDTVSGLQWQDDYSDNKGYAPDNTIPNINCINAKAYCAALNIAGLDDWRLPSREELFTLLEYNGTTAATTLFNWQHDSFYWTRTDHLPSTTLADAWTMQLNSADVLFGDKVMEHHDVRCVRGDGFVTAFVKSKNSVEDTLMQLQWQDTPEVLSSHYNWSKAIDYCEGLTLNGYDNWRLPSIAELFSIIDDRKHSPATVHYFANEQGGAYWSATNYLPAPGYSWVLYTSDGRPGFYAKGSTAYHTRCVRDIIEPMPVTQTGQSSCYDAAGTVISCSKSGQDGEYKAGAPRHYSKPFSGVVKDEATGLMWQEHSSVAAWEAANTICSDLTLGSFSNWRLPSKYEMIMLTDRSQLNTLIDPIFQDSVVSPNWWTHSTYAGDNTKAWTVGTEDNIVSKGGTSYVRCVRGPIPLHGYWSRKGDTVTDHRTRLQWQDDSRAGGNDGPEWSGAPNWMGAMNNCEKLILDGRSDWRLPNINELHTLVDLGHIGAAMSPVFQNVIVQDYGDYWSSTTADTDHAKAYGIDMSNGDDFREPKSSPGFVRCVRGPVSDNDYTFLPAVLMYLLN